jgi:hypothetical protein
MFASYYIIVVKDFEQSGALAAPRPYQTLQIE